MAVGLKVPRNIASIAGVRVGAVDAGIRNSPGEDLAIFLISENTTIAGTFTSNKARAAPVEIAANFLFQRGMNRRGTRRALIVNSGNANAGLGQRGVDDCLEVCELTAGELEIEHESVIPFSTGVIGEPLPIGKFHRSIPLCVAKCADNDWLAAARAIMTTDTVPKAVTRSIEFESGQRVTVTGISKGSGMIKPNMATMLAFIATDAEIESEALQKYLSSGVELSFNQISVDGDMSTNDACIAMATGESGVSIQHRSTEEAKFIGVFHSLLTELAQAIVRDGEGATKFITITVSGGSSIEDCRKVAMSVANSPLVKTAMHASDPNWGRIYAAVGKSEADAMDMQKLEIQINGTAVMIDGALNPSYREAEIADSLKSDEIFIHVDLGFDTIHSATVWTTDLSAEYVRINAEYRS